MHIAYALAALVAAGAVIIALAAIAARLLWRLRNQRRRQRQQRAETDARREHNRRFAEQSIAILARTALAGQVGLTEASIRITTLLNFVSGHDPHGYCNALYRLTSDTDHIPRLDDWRALDAPTRRDYQTQMDQLEQQHRGAIETALSELTRRYPMSERRDSGVKGGMC